MATSITLINTQPASVVSLYYMTVSGPVNGSSPPTAWSAPATYSQISNFTAPRGWTLSRSTQVYPLTSTSPSLPSSPDPVIITSTVNNRPRNAIIIPLINNTTIGRVVYIYVYCWLNVNPLNQNNRPSDSTYQYQGSAGQGSIINYVGTTLINQFIRTTTTTSPSVIYYIYRPDPLNIINNTSSAIYYQTVPTLTTSVNFSDGVRTSARTVQPGTSTNVVIADPRFPNTNIYLWSNTTTTTAGGVQFAANLRTYNFHINSTSTPTTPTIVANPSVNGRTWNVISTTNINNRLKINNNSTKYIWVQSLPTATQNINAQISLFPVSAAQVIAPGGSYDLPVIFSPFNRIYVWETATAIAPTRIGVLADFIAVLNSGFTILNSYSSPTNTLSFTPQSDPSIWDVADNSALKNIKINNTFPAGSSLVYLRYSYTTATTINYASQTFSSPPPDLVIPPQDSRTVPLSSIFPNVNTAFYFWSGFAGLGALSDAAILVDLNGNVIASSYPPNNAPITITPNPAGSVTNWDIVPAGTNPQQITVQNNTSQNIWLDYAYTTVRPSPVVNKVFPIGAIANVPPSGTLPINLGPNYTIIYAWYSTNISDIGRVSDAVWVVDNSGKLQAGPIYSTPAYLTVTPPTSTVSNWVITANRTPSQVYTVLNLTNKAGVLIYFQVIASTSFNSYIYNYNYNNTFQPDGTKNILSGSVPIGQTFKISNVGTLGFPYYNIYLWKSVTTGVANYVGVLNTADGSITQIKAGSLGATSTASYPDVNMTVVSLVPVPPGTLPVNDIPSDSGGFPWWGWLIIGILVVVILMVIIGVFLRGPSSTEATPQIVQAEGNIGEAIGGVEETGEEIVAE